MSVSGINELFNIISHPKFLRMEGLSGDIPFFIQTYDIEDQQNVYKMIGSLTKRLSVSGVKTLHLGLYDMVLEHFKEAGEWGDVLNHERSVDKEEFLGDLIDALGSDDVIKPYFESKLSQDDYQVLLISQVGEVFPFLRSHNLLNYIQSMVKNIPLILFFPGEYVTSYEHGFNLKLFNIDEFEGPYYRAFKLEDYKIRENLDGDA